MAIYFTSDLHFGHRAAVTMNERPFANVEEMNEEIIRRYNEVVSENDIVYFLGDICYRIPLDEANALISRLNGRKILCKGNHDKEYDKSLFEGIYDYLEIRENGLQICCMHFPMLQWTRSRYNSIHLHGHMHNAPAYNLEQRKKGIRRYDVGVDANDFRPVSLDEIRAFFSYKEKEVENMDLKEYVRIDRSKLEAMLPTFNKLVRKTQGLGYVGNVERNVYQWMEYLEYSKERTPMQNFIRYKVGATFQLFEEGKDDGDITPPVMEHFREVLLAMDEVEEVAIGKEISEFEKYRAIKVRLTNTEFYLETDTSFALMVDCNQFMNMMIPKVEGLSEGSYWPKETYYKWFELKDDGSNYSCYKYFYYMMLMDKLSGALTTESEKECYLALEKRAATIHTIPNIMLVPYGYNGPRACELEVYGTTQKIKDRLDLTIQDWERMVEANITDECFRERLSSEEYQNDKASLESVKFLLRHRDELLPVCPHMEDANREAQLHTLTEKSKAITTVLEEGAAKKILIGRFCDFDVYVDEKQDPVKYLEVSYNGRPCFKFSLEDEHFPEMNDKEYIEHVFRTWYGDYKTAISKMVAERKFRMLPSWE